MQTTLDLTNEHLRDLEGVEIRPGLTVSGPGGRVEGRHCRNTNLTAVGALARERRRAPSCSFCYPSLFSLSHTRTRLLLPSQQTKQTVDLTTNRLREIDPRVLALTGEVAALGQNSRPRREGHPSPPAHPLTLSQKKNQQASKPSACARTSSPPPRGPTASPPPPSSATSSCATTPSPRSRTCRWCRRRRRRPDLVVRQVQLPQRPSRRGRQGAQRQGRADFVVREVQPGEPMKAAAGRRGREFCLKGHDLTCQGHHARVDLAQRRR
jgi:hypothetical protein